MAPSRSHCRLLLASMVMVACSPPALPPILVVGNDDSLVAMGLDGGQTVLVAADPDRNVSQATWAPDGRLAVWTEIDADAGRAGIAMGNEENQRRIDGGTVPFFYSWSPTGEHVAYLGNAQDGSGVALGLLDVAAGTARLVDAGAPYYLDWAPDGATLAVHAGTEMALLGLDGVRRPLDLVPGRFQAPDFLPDGRLLVAVADPRRGWRSPISTRSV